LKKICPLFLGGIGAKAERSAQGSPVQSKKDFVGKVIPGTGKSIGDMLKGIDFKRKGPLLSKDNLSIDMGGEDTVVEAGVSIPFMDVSITMNLSELERTVKPSSPPDFRNGEQLPTFDNYK